MMDWSYTHNRMMSVLERIHHPKKYIKYYCCGILICKRRSRSNSGSSSEDIFHSAQGSTDNNTSESVSPYHSMTE